MQEATQRTTSDRRYRLILGLAAAGLALYGLAVWFDWWPGLRGWRNYPEGWTWPLYPAPPPERFGPVLGWIAFVGALLWLAERRIATGPGARWGTALALAGLVVGGYGLQVSLLGLKAANPQQLLVERVTSRVFTSYFTLAASPGTNFHTFFRDYPAVFPTRLCPHCREHPPGPALTYWLVIRAAEALPPAWQSGLGGAAWSLVGSSPSLAALSPPLTDAQLLAALVGGNGVLLLTALLVMPLYGLARRLGPPGGAWRGVALGVALPGVLLMAPEFDQVLALVTATTLYCALRGLATEQVGRAVGWGAAAGLALAGGLFLSWALLVVIGAVGLLGLIGWAAGRSALFPTPAGGRVTSRHLAAWLGALLGAILAFAALVAALGLDVPGVLTYNLPHAALAEAGRPYLVWLFYGPLDFVQFLGLPLAAVTLAAIRLRRPPPLDALPADQESVPVPALRQLLTRFNVYAILFWLLVVGIALAGRSKSEQGRLLIFLMPFALVAVYAWAGRTHPPGRWLILLFVAQLGVTLVIGARWFVP